MEQSFVQPVEPARRSEGGGTPNTNPIVLATDQAAVFTANPFYDSRFSPEPRRGLTHPELHKTRFTFIPFIGEPVEQEQVFSAPPGRDLLLR